MENITLGQIAAGIGILLAIGGFFIAIFRWYKQTFENRFLTIEKNIATIQSKEEKDLDEYKLEMGKEIAELRLEAAKQQRAIDDSKEERFIIVEGLLACLKGLHNDLKCNGPVTKGIENLELYLMKQSHRLD